jgi:hypothetical protein
MMMVMTVVVRVRPVMGNVHLIGAMNGGLAVMSAFTPARTAGARHRDRRTGAGGVTFTRVSARGVVVFVFHTQ